MDRHDGYVNLNNIMRLVYPIIMEDTVEFYIPKQSNDRTLPLCVNKLVTFVERDYLKGHPITK